MIYNSSMADTIKDLRNELGAYLTKPLQISSGDISTQQNLVATSLTTGGLAGEFLIKEHGKIVVWDGNNNRVLIGELS